MRRGLILLAAAVMCAGASSPAGAQSWNIQIVDDAGTTGYHSRVVATSDGTPYIFYLGNNSYLTMAWWVSGGAETGGWDRDVLSYQDMATDFSTAYSTLPRSRGAWHPRY
jgi:hypothetical protein